MKNLLRPWRCATPATSLAVILIAATPAVASAAPLNSGRISQLANDVKLLPSQAPARPAALNDSVAAGAVLRTGADSRVELTFADGVLVRVSQHSNVRFASPRGLELGDGALLVHVPKAAGATAIDTDFGKVSTTGATVAVEILKPSTPGEAASQPLTRYRVSVLEGDVELRSTDDTNRVVKITAGEAAIGSSADWLSKVVKFGVAEWMQRHSLVAEFRPLPASVLAVTGTPGAGTTFAALFRSTTVAMTGMSGSGFGSINPSNLSDRGGNEVSPSEERMTICHNGQTLTLPRDAAERHLRNHRDDSAGACR